MQRGLAGNHLGKAMNHLQSYLKGVRRVLIVTMERCGGVQRTSGLFLRGFGKRGETRHLKFATTYDGNEL